MYLLLLKSSQFMRKPSEFQPHLRNWLVSARNNQQSEFPTRFDTNLKKAVLTCTHNQCFKQKYRKKNKKKFILNFQFSYNKKSLYILWVCFHNAGFLMMWMKQLKKTCLRDFRPGPTQTSLYSHRRWLEA